MTGPVDYLLVILYTLPGAVIGLVLHELAHSVIALRAGDPTPLREKRMTLDPLRQLDPFGFPALLISGFGWGRPVHREAPGILGPAQRAAVAAAGPVAHLVVAAIFAVTLRVELLTSGIDLGGFVTLSQRSAQGILAALLLQGFFINIALFIYNALPLPGLDGYAFLRRLFFTRVSRAFLWAEAYRFIVYTAVIVVVVVLPHVSDGRINPLSAATLGTATLVFSHAVDPGTVPLFLGLPNIFMLFS
ncbi:MAG: site-2 protease family protein [Chloroflexi bacterium]|nr:MAG: site-2 protease family protein [Chloroflexota bacterium]